MARSLGLSHSHLLPKRLNSRGQSQLGLLQKSARLLLSPMLDQPLEVLQVHGCHLIQQVQLLLEKKVNQEYQLSRMNVVCVQVCTFQEDQRGGGTLAWGGCCVYAKGGSMKNVYVK